MATVTDKNNYLWVEKYRPNKVDDCILQDNIKQTFKEFLEAKQIPNLLLYGTAGTGKTTIARALAAELGADLLFINASEESGIDTIRVKIRQFCSTVSFSDSLKIVLLDEADFLNANSAQPALRAGMEEYSKNCRFILTCNQKNRIIPALQSRTIGVDFSIPKKKIPEIAGQFMDRVMGVLKQENVEADPKVVAQLIKNHFPDFRRVLNELQRYSAGGKIDVGILAQVSEVSVGELLKHLKEKNFRGYRTWVVENANSEPTRIYRKIYDSLYESMEPASIPQAVLIIAQYQYQAAFAADSEVNLVAALTELSMNCKFK